MENYFDESFFLGNIHILYRMVNSLFASQDQIHCGFKSFCNSITVNKSNIKFVKRKQC